MADGSVIGALRFVLGADVSQLEVATGRASKSMRAAAKAGEVAGAAIGRAFAPLAGMFAGAFAIDRLVAFGTEAIKSAAALGRFADQAGLTVREFEGLDFALRGAMVPTEQLAQGFAIFSRNLSDLQRGTGPFLDFLRRFAPALEDQFRAANGTAEAFGVLTDAVNSLGNQQDRVRLLNAAGAEQFGRLANEIRQGRSAIDATRDSFEGFGDAGVKAAADMERRFSELSRTIGLTFKKAIVVATDALSRTGTASADSTEHELKRLEGIRASQLALGRDVSAVTAQIEKQRVALRTLREAADNEGGAPGANGELQRDAFAERQRLLGESLSFEEQIARRRQELERGVQQGVITTTEATRALALVEAQRRDAQMQTAQSLGAVIGINEQYEAQLGRISTALSRGAVTGEQASEAQQGAAIAMAGSYATAFEGISQNVAKAFGENKAVAAASTIVSTLAAAIKALELYGPTPLGFAAAAAAAATAAGVANLMKINSTTSTTKSFAGGSGSAVAAQAPAAAMAPSQSFTINLPNRAYSPDEVAAIIDGINERVNNGVTLIATKVAT